jgi:hypothetical protein
MMTPIRLSRVPQMSIVRARSLRIGELAKKAGVNVQTIRFYEREGLLAPPPAPLLAIARIPPPNSSGCG